MFTVLLVCTANVCRSPMAEVILRRLVTERGLQDIIEVKSAGIYAMDGQKSSDLTVKVAAENGLDLEGHRSQSITPRMIHQSDLILVMTPNHRNDLLQFFPKQTGKIYTLKEFERKKIPAKAAVDDPIGMPLNFYRQIFNEIQSELKRIFPKIEKLAKKRVTNNSSGKMSET
ncbi:MAG: low molecular weight protein arginine phosphatase [Calditrichaeota bacterium]|nr:low molecular weight protein arginine phosphatase [Calditrichota bacterium]